MDEMIRLLTDILEEQKQANRALASLLSVMITFLTPEQRQAMEQTIRELKEEGTLR